MGPTTSDKIRSFWTYACILKSTPFFLSIPVAEQSKVWVCDRSPAEIVGTNPTGCMDVCLFWVLCCKVDALRRADHSSRVVLPTVVRCFVWYRNLVNEEVLAHWGLLDQKERNKQTLFFCFVNWVSCTCNNLQIQLLLARPNVLSYLTIINI